MSDEFKPGLYEHYKGGLYRALFKGRLSESREVEMVIYIPLTPNPSSPYPRGQPWIRPWKIPLIEGDDCWCDPVTVPETGETKPRFKYIGE